MDMSLVAAILSQQQGAFQSQVSTTVLKQNLDQQKSDILTLLNGAQQSLAHVGPGVGGNLNISAGARPDIRSVTLRCSRSEPRRMTGQAVRSQPRSGRAE